MGRDHLAITGANDKSATHRQLHANTICLFLGFSTHQPLADQSPILPNIGQETAEKCLLIANHLPPSRLTIANLLPLCPSHKNHGYPNDTSPISQHNIKISSFQITNKMTDLYQHSKNIYG